MSENSPEKIKPHWELGKSQFAIVIVIGVIFLAQAMAISTDKGTTPHTIKVLIGLIGACVIFFGIWARPTKVERKSEL